MFIIGFLWRYTFDNLHYNYNYRHKGMVTLVHGSDKMMQLRLLVHVEFSYLYPLHFFLGQVIIIIHEKKKDCHIYY